MDEYTRWVDEQRRIERLKGNERTGGIVSTLMTWLGGLIAIGGLLVGITYFATRERSAGAFDGIGWVLLAVTSGLILLGFGTSSRTFLKSA